MADDAKQKPGEKPRQKTQPHGFVQFGAYFAGDVRDKLAEPPIAASMKLNGVTDKMLARVASDTDE